MPQHKQDSANTTSALGRGGAGGFRQSQSFRSAGGWAPSAAPTSCAKDVGTQTIVEAP